MAIMKTRNLVGAQLMWAVEQAECSRGEEAKKWWEDVHRAAEKMGNFYTVWTWLGGVIEREKISVTVDHSGVWIACQRYNYADEPQHMQSGPNATLAILRCYVASKLGDEVDVPEELL